MVWKLYNNFKNGFPLQLVISSGDLLENMRNLTIFGTDYSFKRLRDKVDKKDWRNHGAAAVVNAYYSPIENSIRGYSVLYLSVIRVNKLLSVIRVN